MEQAKTIEILKDKLLAFEREVQHLIAVELSRINRKVTADEMAFVPFIDEVGIYIEFIQLNREGEIVIGTYFEDIEEKGLSAFISDNEITHWQLIELLEMVMKIK